MWVFSETGFYSIVEHKRKLGFVLVRARVKKDLEMLRDKYGLNMVIYDDKSGSFDYQYRVCVRKEDVAKAISLMVKDIYYHNFKDRVEELSSDVRASVYLNVWYVLRSHLGRGWLSLINFGRSLQDAVSQIECDESEEESTFINPVYKNFSDSSDKL